MRLLVATAASLLLAAGAASAQTFPSKPVTLIIPYATGGNSDIMGRALAQKLSDLWKQSVVVENRPGGTTTVGTAYAAKQPADGYSLLLVAPPGVITQHVFPNLSYVLLRDLKAISWVAFYPLVTTVHPSVPARNLTELFAHARAKPGLAYPTPGAGTTVHLITEQMAIDQKLDLTHVPYKSGGQGVTDLAGGRLQFYSGPNLEVLPQIKAGRIIPIAVLSDRRSKVLPDVTTTVEQGFPQYQVSSWTTIGAPAATPQSIIDKISADIAQVIKDPDFRDKLESQGAEFVGSTAAAAQELWMKEDARWAPLVKTLKITPDN
jgi:tripartite-type tricarboxylate transporter receptor subunit TctC